MVKTSDILAEISRLLAEKYPGWPVYANSPPTDLVRPSFSVKCTKVSELDANRSMVQRTVSYTITYYPEVDEAGIGDAEALLDVQDEVTKLFRTGYVKAGGRAIKVKSSTGGAESDRSFIDLQFEYFDDRAEEAGEELLMGMINTKIKEKG